jgi:hypothetical protein
MAVFGAFWMFAWLIGANGYGETKGGIILGLNLLMVILAVVVSSAASAFLTKIIQAKTQWSVLLVAPLSVLVVVIVALFALFVGSLLIIGIVGQTP